MGYKIKNITYLLDKININYNKPINIKLQKNLINNIYKILPYQEIILDLPLLPKEIKKMEMLGMLQCLPISNDIINSINNPIKNKEVVKTENKITEVKKRKSNKNL